MEENKVLRLDDKIDLVDQMKIETAIEPIMAVDEEDKSNEILDAVAQNVKSDDNKLTEDQLDQIANILFDKKKDAEENDVMEEEPKEMTSEMVEFVCDPETGENVRPVDHKDAIKSSNVSILDVMDGKTEDAVDTEALESSIKEKFNMGSEDEEKFVDLVLRYKAGEVDNLYKEMPDVIKDTIKSIAFQNNIPREQYNMIANMVMEEFLSDSELNKVFVDFETSMGEALKIPSTEDLYSSNIQDMMENKTLELAEKIEDESPEKAETLRQISKAFTDSYTLVRMGDALDNSARARKAIRRDYDKAKHFCDEINFRNEKTMFKMPDVTLMIPALKKVLKEKTTLKYDIDSEDGKIVTDSTTHADVEFTDTDVNKFMTLFCKTCDNYDPNGIVDASYVYYAAKNIIMLAHTDEGKTPFAVELINNIKDMIIRIREKEAEFNANNPMQRMSKREQRKLRKHSADRK